MLAVDHVHFPATPSPVPSASSDGSGDPKRPARRVPARVWLSLGAAVVLGGGLVMHREQAGRAIDELGAMSAQQLLLVVAAVVVHKVVHASLLWTSLPGLSKRRALVVNEIHTGCTNSTVGGSAIGTGLKVSMLRAGGHCERAIAASIVCTGVATSFGLWSMAWTQAVPRVLTGNGKGGENLVVFAGTIVLTTSALFWWAVLCRPGLAAIGVSVGERIRRRLITLVPHRSRPAVAAVDLHAEATRLRMLGQSLVRTRFLAIAGATVASQLTIALVLVTTLIALNPEGGVPILSVLSVFALARVLGSLAPLPGGIGVLDVGLASGLVHLGIPQPTVIAAIALFRALTFVLPIATGMLALMIARRVDAARVRADLPTAPAAEPHIASPAIAATSPAYAA